MAPYFLSCWPNSRILLFPWLKYHTLNLREEQKKRILSKCYEPVPGNHYTMSKQSAAPVTFICIFSFSLVAPKKDYWRCILSVVGSCGKKLMCCIYLGSEKKINDNKSAWSYSWQDVRKLLFYTHWADAALHYQLLGVVFLGQIEVFTLFQLFLVSANIWQKIYLL